MFLQNSTRFEERRRSASQPPDSDGLHVLAAAGAGDTPPPPRSERAESTSSNGEHSFDSRIMFGGKFKSDFSGGGSEGHGPFSHSSTLGGSDAEGGNGGPKRGKAWHAEVAKFQLQKRVSQVRAGDHGVCSAHLGYIYLNLASLTLLLGISQLQ